MLETIRNAWRVPELRKKLIFTLIIVFIFRLGCHLPVPFVNIAALQSVINADSSSFMGYLSIFTGGALQYGAIFAMSVTPYINASIIIQLLTVAIPALERLQKEGEEGRKRLAAITRVVTICLGLIQGGAFYFYLRKSTDSSGNPLLTVNKIAGLPISGLFAEIFVAVVIIVCFTAGSALMMWLGEQIDKVGVGNGISILLFAGIISRGPTAFQYLYNYAAEGKGFAVFGIVVVFVVAFVAIVWMTGAERRIPVQYAKRVVGRKMYGGQSSHIPIKVNMSGVMPIIFASSILLIPSMILGFIRPALPSTGATAAQTAAAIQAENGIFYRLFSLLGYKSALYAVLLFLFIIGFAYFYVTIQYNPVEMANNLRKNSGAIPGIRPGKPTSDFISKILSKITLLGALFLGVVAVLPTIVGALAQISIGLGGTTILIIVGVALDTVTKLESQMLMRHYKGFLD